MRLRKNMGQLDEAPVDWRIKTQRTFAFASWRHECISTECPVPGTSNGRANPLSRLPERGGRQGCSLSLRDCIDWVPYIVSRGGRYRNM
jgi:hypothetical protein